MRGATARKLTKEARKAVKQDFLFFCIYSNRRAFKVRLRVALWLLLGRLNPSHFAR